MAALLVEKQTLDNVRSAKVLSRSVRINLAELPGEEAEKVRAFLLAIGGIWKEEKGAWLFKKHPLAAIGRAIMDDIIICEA